jgi:4-amino-4-deoxy-L-arabinose transferase-like glycosyltransferase
MAHKIITNISLWLARWRERGVYFYTHHQWHFFLLLACLFGGAFFRLYNLGETMMFQADQGRDALRVAAMFKHFDLAFIGPVTSIGNMYLGPFYYYFILPWLWLTYPNPIGPALGVALANIGLIFLTYYWGRHLVGARAALWATFMLAFSQIAINYSRFSWNPNLSSFLSLITLYLLYLTQTRSPKYWKLTALAAGLLIQLHYVNLIVVVVCGLFWLHQFWCQRRHVLWLKRNHFWRQTLIATLVFVLTLTPLFLFDLKYGGINLQALNNIFVKEQGFAPLVVKDRPLLSALGNLKSVFGRSGLLYGALFLPEIESLARFGINVYQLRVWLSEGLLVLFFIYVYRRRQQPAGTGRKILVVTIILSLVALSFYQHSIFDHYVLFFLPVLFLSVGTLLAALARYKKIYPLLAGLFVLGFCWGNYKVGFFTLAGPSYKTYQALAKTIVESLSADETFAFVLINESRDLLGDNYRYFFDYYARPGQLLTNEQITAADSLFVIDETRQLELYGHESFEIVVYRDLPGVTYSAFPYLTDGPDIYRLQKESVLP